MTGARPTSGSHPERLLLIAGPHAAALVDLAVADGKAAQHAWREATNPATALLRRSELRQALLDYCERDTWAMVLLLRRLLS